MPRSSIKITVNSFNKYSVCNFCSKVREGKTLGKVVDVENSDASISEVMLVVQVGV